MLAHSAAALVGLEMIAQLCPTAAAPAPAAVGACRRAASATSGQVDRQRHRYMP
jgi:hypothetical protein